MRLKVSSRLVRLACALAIYRRARKAQVRAIAREERTLLSALGLCAPCVG